MTVYPGSVDTFPTRNLKQLIDPDHINNLGAAITAIETTLGTNPQGFSASVAARLSASQVVTAAAMTALSSPRAVTFADTGAVRYLDATDAGDVGRLPLVTMQSAAEAGDSVNLVGQGATPWPAGGLTPGQSLFLGRFGTLMPVQPTSVAFTQIIAYALDADTIYVDPQPPILF